MARYIYDTTEASQIPCRRIIEVEIESPQTLDDPSHNAKLTATFFAPSGRQVLWQGFWDGDNTWRARFAPDEEGPWRYVLSLNEQPGDRQLITHAGQFTCIPSLDENEFDRHGPLRLAEHKRHLTHVDGAPFFWLADTAWNGPLRSTEEEWQTYLQTRTRQRFSGVQWVATQWRAAPDGDREGNLAFTGHDHIKLNPAFFQRLDRYMEATASAGLLNVPVMLWAIGGGGNPQANPGYALPEDQAILLARYMVARWSAYPTAWILGGDGKYFGENAARWRRIGRAVFADWAEELVAMHCGGEQWPADEFRAEIWLDMLGYQSGHGDGESTLTWLVKGPPATEWNKTPRLFQINLEPAYENHVAYHSREPHSPHSVRRAVYWSLLNAPTAGVSYGGHGVWGWDDGTEPPVDHERSGIPLPWQEALTMPGAEQMAYVVEFFTAIDWWRLQPAQDLLEVQPGDEDISRYVTAARSQDGGLAVLYTPAGDEIQLAAAHFDDSINAAWCDPRSSEQIPAEIGRRHDSLQFTTPSDEDWLLIIQQPTQ